MKARLPWHSFLHRKLLPVSSAASHEGLFCLMAHVKLCYLCASRPLWLVLAFFNKHIYFPYKQSNVTNSRRVLVQPPACSHSPQAVLLGPLYPSSPLSTDSVSSKSQVHHPVTQTYKAITYCCMLLITKSSQKYRK